MKKTKDYLYVIFIGLILYLSGAIILGAISYFVGTFIGVDFISIVLFFLLSMFLSRQILRGINMRNNFVSIMVVIYTCLMYIIKDYTVFFVMLLLEGYDIMAILSTAPIMLINSFLLIFSLDFSIDGIFTSIIIILSKIIDILIMVAGAYYSYRITRRE